MAGSGVVEQQVIVVMVAAQELPGRKEQEITLPGPGAGRKRRLHVQLRQRSGAAVRIVFEEYGVE